MSEWQGNITVGDTIYWLFPSSVNGVPTNLAGSPACSVYKNSTTESTTGITLTAPYDSVVGMNQIAINTGADGTFYAAGNNFDVVITTGTLGGVSVVGQTIGSFAIQDRYPSPAQTATTIWTDTTASDFTTALSVGKSVMNGVTLGTGLTVNAVTGLTASNLDTTVSSRMASYTQPTGFLAATFPTTVASTTNITAGTVTTISGNVTGSVGSVVGLTASNLDVTVSSRLAPTVAARTLDVNATGGAGIDWGNIDNPTTAVNFSGTQIQSVNNLASGTDSINTVATSNSTVTTGSTVSGTYASTVALDGVYWQIADTTGTLDMYFEFNVGTYGVPTTAVWTGGLTTAVNSLKVYAYNWGGTAWEQVGTIAGTTSLITNNAQFDFTTSHVGIGGNLGLVRLRFANTGLTSANFYTDQVLCGYTNVFTTAQLATAVWQDATAGDFTTAGSIGKDLKTGAVPGAANGLFIAGSNAATTANITGNITGNLSGSVGSVTGAVGSVTGNVGGNVTGSVGSVVGAVGSVTGNVGGNVTGSVGSVVGLTASNLDTTVSSRATPAQVNAEVVDVVSVDTWAEPGQGAPAATNSLINKLSYLYKAWRNRSNQTSSLYQLYADDESTVDQKATVSDDGTTFTREEVGTGP